MYTINSGLREKYIDLLHSLCSIETPSSNKNNIDKMSNLIKCFAKKLGYDTEKIPFEKAGDYLLIKLNDNSDERPVMLMAHMDTVHKEGSFGSEIVSCDGDWMLGPGVMDCKGGIITGLYAMELLKMDKNFERPIYLLLTSDEEVNNCFSGQKGIDVITDTAKKSCAVFNLEPGKPGEITVGRKGILSVFVEITGVASHAGNAYFDGASAIKEASHMVLEIESLSQKDGITFNCGVINGGTVANIVADKCSVGVDIRVSTPEEMIQAENLLYELSKKNVDKNTCRALKVLSKRPPMMMNKMNIELLNTWNSSAGKLGIKEFKGTVKGGGSDAAYTVIAGVPTLCSCGAIGFNEHTVNEKLDLSSLDERVALICNTIKLIRD